MNFKLLFRLPVLFYFLLCMPLYSETKEVTLSQKITFKTGDIIRLKNSEFIISIGANKGTECAVPGFNCGSGYQPPHPTFKINCGKMTSCPYTAMTEIKDATSGILSIEDEKSCEKNDPENCFREFTRSFDNDEKCLTLKSVLGQYYCLNKFSTSAREKNRKICDLLPSSIYALQWNCFYEYAIRYRDPTFCDKYAASELSGRDRCLLKMAELLKDHTLCAKISASKEHSYREQCAGIKFN